MSLLLSRVTQQQFINKWNLKSPNNGATATKALRWWNNYLTSIAEIEETIFPKLKLIKDDTDFYLFLNRIVEFMVEGKLHPHSVSTYFSFIKDYLRKNGFRIYNEDIKQFIDLPKANRESKVPVTKEMIKILADNAPEWLRGTIYVLGSSGMRISEFLQLKESDIHFDIDPVQIHLRAETTKTHIDRITFVSRQAKDIFPKLKPYQPLRSLLNYEQQFMKLRKKCNMNEQYRTSTVHHVTPHRLRAYVKTTASNLHGKDYAEDLIGHEEGLVTYFAMPVEQKAEKYKILEPLVTF